jgi:peptidoglycan/LPS O-acetylase OafA/YrhL
VAREVVALAPGAGPPPPQSSRLLGHRPGLDGLRAIAVGLVLLHHTAAILIPAEAEGFFSGGFLGVDLFFVLSGFLITTLLLERRERREARPLRSFYARRALRLLPAVAALLVGNLLVAVVEEEGVSSALKSFGVVFTYTTNWALLYAFGDLSPNLSHLWSLAIEEQFYAIWPLVLLGALSLGLVRRRMAWLCIALALAAAIWRAALYQSGTEWLAIYIRTDARADALLIGAALALVRPDVMLGRIHPRVRSAAGTVALVVFIAIASAVHGDSGSLYLGGYTVVALLAGALITIELAGPWALHSALSSRPMVYVGRLSYSLYLWHFLVFRVVDQHVADSSTASRLALGWGLTAAVSVASFRLVERPALRVKDRIGRRRPADTGG